MNETLSRFQKEELKQQIANTKHILEKDMPLLERCHWECELKAWEIALFELEERMRNNEQ